MVFESYLYVLYLKGNKTGNTPSFFTETNSKGCILKGFGQVYGEAECNNFYSTYKPGFGIKNQNIV